MWLVAGADPDRIDSDPTIEAVGVADVIDDALRSVHEPATQAVTEAVTSPILRGQWSQPGV
jgi:hypothetical protein